MYLIAKDPVNVNEKSTVDRVSDNKVDRAKIGTKIAKFKSYDKSKGKNLIQALAQSSRSGFLTFRARKAFTKLRQDFIKVPIFPHFDLNCHIQIETNVSDYALVESSVS